MTVVLSATSQNLSPLYLAHQRLDAARQQLVLARGQVAQAADRIREAQRRQERIEGEISDYVYEELNSVHRPEVNMGHERSDPRRDRDFVDMDAARNNSPELQAARQAERLAIIDKTRMQRVLMAAGIDVRAAESEVKDLGG